MTAKQHTTVDFNSLYCTDGFTVYRQCTATLPGQLVVALMVS